MKSKIIKMILLGIAVLAALSVAVMLLWNLLLPAIFGIATINIWQALGLFVLSRLLFGGFGFGKGRMMMGHGMNNKNMGPFREKWMKMTPEERKEFINKRRQFGFGHPFDRDRFDGGKHEGQGNGNE